MSRVLLGLHGDCFEPVFDRATSRSQEDVANALEIFHEAAKPQDPETRVWRVTGKQAAGACISSASA